MQLASEPFRYSTTIFPNLIPDRSFAWPLVISSFFPVGRSWADYSFVTAYALEVLSPWDFRLTLIASYGIGILTVPRFTRLSGQVTNHCSEFLPSPRSKSRARPALLEIPLP